MGAMRQHQWKFNILATPLCVLPQSSTITKMWDGCDSEDKYAQDSLLGSWVGNGTDWMQCTDSYLTNYRQLWSHESCRAVRLPSLLSSHCCNCFTANWRRGLLVLSFTLYFVPSAVSIHSEAWQETLPLTIPHSQHNPSHEAFLALKGRDWW